MMSYVKIVKSRILMHMQSSYANGVIPPDWDQSVLDSANWVMRSTPNKATGKIWLGLGQT